MSWSQKLFSFLISWQWKSSRSILHLQWVFLWTNKGWSTKAESCRTRGPWQTTVSKAWISKQKATRLSSIQYAWSSDAFIATISPFVLMQKCTDITRLVFCSDVGGKVIHLVERAPPPPSQPGSGSGGAAADSGPSSSSSGPSQGPPHDRNANSYVMLGTFNLPVNIMDPQQIQVWFLVTHLLTRIPVCEHCALAHLPTFMHFV